MSYQTEDGQTYWNGEPWPARRVTGIVAESPFPLFWGRHLVGTRVHAVEVLNYDGTPFYLYNDDHTGWKKVTEGRGMMNYGHKSLDLTDIESNSPALVLPKRIPGVSRAERREEARRLKKLEKKFRPRFS